MAMSTEITTATPNAFYKNPNSSVSSTDLVATNRFTTHLLSKDPLKKPQNEISTDPKTVLISKSAASSTILISPKKSKKPSGPPPNQNPPASPKSRKSTKKPSSVLNKISMFENSTPNGEQLFKRNFKPILATGTKNDSLNRSSNQSENFKNTNTPIKSFAFKTQQNQKSKNSKLFKGSDNKENPNFNTAHIPASLSVPETVITEDDTQPIASSSFAKSPTSEKNSNDTSFSSIIGGTRSKKTKHSVSTAFTNDPIYGKSKIKSSVDTSFNSLGSGQPFYQIPRSGSNAGSIHSERPLFDMPRAGNFSSGASIAGSMVSERPLFDVTSENMNDNETVYKRLHKSSNSILSDSLFDTHEMADSSLSENIDRSKNPQSDDTTESKVIANRILREPSVEQKLDEFSYLFNIEEGGDLGNPKPRGHASMIIASSSVKSHLNDPKRHSMIEAPDVSKVSKANNTVRFNEEITTYEHPEISYEEGDSTNRDGEEENDDEDDVTIESEMLVVTNGKDNICSRDDAAEFFNKPITHTVVKKAIQTAENRSKIFYSDRYKKEYQMLEETRVKRKSSTRNHPRSPTKSPKYYSDSSYLSGRLQSSELVNEEQVSETSIFRRLSNKRSKNKENLVLDDSEWHSNLQSSRTRSSRAPSIQSSRVSFVSTIKSHSHYKKIFPGSIFTSRSNVTLPRNSNDIPDAPVNLMQNPLLDSEVNGLRKNSGEPTTEGELKGTKKSINNFYGIKSASQSKRSLKAFRSKNFSVISLNRQSKSSNPKTGNSETVKKHGSVFNNVMSKIASFF
ncbi:hypothetical protein DASC09_040090 [Saccharomycopsis crataegensis]|uniref:Uncharacterized protein n=1 Tax=Saccharomycopsis crataegensis TaxID=43959 RepID=A0AAV5QPL3_9ASCO|nr:hypothetical protein DASC09_040090 [Saccharomycopsis crataegensis]